MFDIGWPEMAVVAVIALVIIGPRDLPRIMRYVGQWAGKARRMARDFQRSFDDIVRESELDEVKKSVNSATAFNPAKELGNSIDPTGALKKSLVPPPADVAEAKTSAATGDEPKPAEDGDDAAPADAAPADAAAQPSPSRDASGDGETPAEPAAQASDSGDASGDDAAPADAAAQPSPSGDASGDGETPAEPAAQASDSGDASGDDAAPADAAAQPSPSGDASGDGETPAEPAAQASDSGDASGDGETPAEPAAQASDSGDGERRRRDASGDGETPARRPRHRTAGTRAATARRPPNRGPRHRTAGTRAAMARRPPNRRLEARLARRIPRRPSPGSAPRPWSTTSTTPRRHCSST